MENYMNDLPALSPNPFDIAGRVIVVTGASSGIGQGVARALAVLGARVVATAPTPEEVAVIEDDAHTNGLEGKILPKLLDVLAVDSIVKFVDDIVAEFGRIDVLFNNAGLGFARAPLDVTESDWDLMMGVNLRGVFFMCQAVGRVMIAQGEGRIVNMASQGGVVGLPDAVVYCASKGGVIMATKALAIEWGRFGLTINALAPTFVYTPGAAPILDDPVRGAEVRAKIPVGRLATTDDIAAAVAYLASPAGRMVNGHVLLVDGGWTAQ
jgi:NAD(P)-dependent dehydrogenase (short-subunit alcohol dehydrogenase family)